MMASHRHRGSSEPEYGFLSTRTGGVPGRSRCPAGLFHSVRRNHLISPEIVAPPVDSTDGRVLPVVHGANTGRRREAGPSRAIVDHLRRVSGYTPDLKDLPNSALPPSTSASSRAWRVLRSKTPGWWMDLPPHGVQVLEHGPKGVDAVRMLLGIDAFYRAQELPRHDPGADGRDRRGGQEPSWGGWIVDSLRLLATFTVMSLRIRGPRHGSSLGFCGPGQSGSNFGREVIRRDATAWASWSTSPTLRDLFRHAGSPPIPSWTATPDSAQRNLTDRQLRALAPAECWG